MDEILEVPPAPASPLDEAAALFQIDQRFEDIWGHLHDATPAVQAEILASLGVDVSSSETLRRDIAQEQLARWLAPLPPTVVISAAEASFDISLPEHLNDLPLELILDSPEHGQTHWTIFPKNLPPLDEFTHEGTKIVKKRIVLPSPIPLGNYTLRMELGSVKATANLIACPDQAYQPVDFNTTRAAGIAVSLYGVRSGRNWGCGDTTDLRGLVDWATEDLKVGFIALNPLHAIPNRQPYNTSPYLPNSTFYRNHIYLDLEQIPDFAASAWAARLAASNVIRSEIVACRDARHVEYERVSRLKLRFLKLLFRQFLHHDYRIGTARAQAFQAYADREDQLLDLFAIHSALDESIHRADSNVWHWHDWPTPYQDPNSIATKQFAAKHWRTVLFYKYIQWQLDLQFADVQAYAKQKGMAIGLYHDLALATDSFGSDLWAHRPFYIAGCRVGSPPDNFSPKGQDWSFPPPNSRRHLEDGYRLFAESIRKAAAHGGALRIDHVMRFFRLYWIPASSPDATKGTYVRDRFEDLVRVLALESVRGKFIVIGEDLGTVPDAMREMLHRFGILSYRLLFFERDAEGQFYAPHEYPDQALVSVTTHDLPTLAGFWTGADIVARRAAGIIPGEADYEAALAARVLDKQKILMALHHQKLLPDWFPLDASRVPELNGELHNAIVGFLAITPSRLFLINQEDLFKDTEQQNLPGTTAEHPNWRTKMRFTLEELRGTTPGLKSLAATAYAKMFKTWLIRTGRENHPGETT